MSIIDGLWRRKEGCNGPKQNEADLRVKLWKLLTECVEKNWDLDVNHVKAHRTDKEKKAMTKEQQLFWKKMRRRVNW